MSSLKKMMHADIEVGEHLSIPLEGMDREDWESSPDGEHVLAEHTPSVNTIKNRWARRLEKKFSAPLEEAQLFSYCMGLLCWWQRDCLKHYENEISEKGFQQVFSEVRKLHQELLQEEPKDEVRSFSPDIKEFHPIPLVSDEEPDWELISEELQELDDVHPLLEAYLQRKFWKFPSQKREKAYSAFEREHKIKGFPLNNTSACLVTETLREDWLARAETQNRPNKKEETIDRICKKIRRAGINTFPAMGKKLFAWSQEKKTKQYFEDSQIQEIWRVFKAKKAAMESFGIAKKYGLK